MALVIGAAAWKQVSYDFIFFLAGLQAVPKTVVEAARIDGARGLHRFRTIVLPLLMPTVYFLLVVNLVYAAFDTFATVYTVNAGGPRPVDPDAGAEGLRRRHRQLRHRLVLGAVGGADGGGDRAVVAAVPLPRPEGRDVTARFLPHAVLVAALVVFALPIWIAVAGSTQDSAAIARGDISLLPRLSGLGVYADVLMNGSAGAGPVWRELLVSAGMALAIAGGKIALSIPSAYAVTFFHFPFRMTAFWLIFLTLMLPVEVRLIPTFQVTSSLNLIDSFAGLTVPLVASATATLLFRQTFLALPDELVEAARMDGAGPLRFLFDVVIPVSAANVAGAVRDPVRLRLETSTCGRCWSPPTRSSTRW